MPYKHIAAHLKKTELACRLHYHQLSHGSNRRKRTTSMSSASSTTAHSPTLPAVAQSPIQEATSREITPPASAGSYGSDSPGHQTSVQLPSIMGRTGSTSHLPAILPKPSNIPPTATMCSPPSGFPGPFADSARNLAPSPFPHQTPPITQGPSLRLDCSLPPPPPSSSSQVDVGRLQSIYATHRSSFWTAIAAEYGAGVSPIVLEQAWKTHVVASGGGNQTPITPATSPNDRDPLYERSDKTRISAILGIDANPRSPKEREMVRRLEEGRTVSVVAGA